MKAEVAIIALLIVGSLLVFSGTRISAAGYPSGAILIIGLSLALIAGVIAFIAYIRNR